MKKMNYLSLIFLLTLLLISQISCIKCFNEKKINKVFKLSVGLNENELGFFKKDDIISQDNINFYYTNGFYYISDFYNKKIFKITEGGLITLVIFNSKQNPFLKPESNTEQTADTSGEIFFKSYSEFPELYPRILAADIDGNIYVENLSPSYKKYSPEGTILNSFIIKFDKNGKLIYKLGSKGKESEPFSYLSDLIINNKGEIVVLERRSRNFLLYKFNRDGELIYKKEFNRHNIPLTREEENFIVDITEVSIGYKNDEIFFMCQYVTEKFGKFMVKSFETVYNKVLIYSMKRDRFIKMITKFDPEYIDLSLYKSNDFVKKFYSQSEKIMKPLPYLIGVDSYDILYFLKRELSLKSNNENKIRILKYNRDGDKKDDFIFELPEKIYFISKFFVSPEGKISFFYIDDEGVQFAEF